MKKTIHTEESLSALETNVLVVTYNAMAAEAREAGGEQYKDVSRFSDRKAAVRRILSLQTYLENVGKEGKQVEVTETTGIVPDELRQDTLAKQQAAMDAVRTTHQPEEESEMAATKKAARKTAPAKKTKTEGVAQRGYAEDAKIKILVKENPRRGEAAKRFELYKEGMTVAEYTKKIGSRAEALVHLRWDVNKGHIKITEK